ncbi:glutamate receptor ionotropic, delta-2-like [Anthonomus grandis grandis]|uniref:glutamate receptor ionotropic, delta-2-like n=1 Tax=Anthonomus grandis grandis TaxID=2921223 RepID=UPI00216593C7|nr:glutamate receptor ionotropic, delta-2-like [Anthonomus grandis grandis]
MFSDKWGTEINKTYGFSGLMRDIITTKTAELSGAPLFMFKKRVPVIDYVAVTTPTIIKFVFRQPKLSYISNLYILPFANEVWLALFGLTILLIFTTFAVNKWERKLDKLSTAEDTDFLTKEGAIFTDAAFLTMSAFCQQGFNNLPKRTPGKLATLIVYLSLMFIFVSYSAKILALLQSSSNSITSLEDLLNSRMLLGALETDYHRIFFSTVKEPLRKAIVEKKIAPPGQRPNYLDLEEGIKRVKAGQFAFHVQLGAAYYVISKTFIEQEKCGLHTIDFFNLGNPYIAIQKNSSYKELLKIG